MAPAVAQKGRVFLDPEATKVNANNCYRQEAPKYSLLDECSRFIRNVSQFGYECKQDNHVDLQQQSYDKVNRIDRQLPKCYEQQNIRMEQQSRKLEFCFDGHHQKRPSCVPWLGSQDSIPLPGIIKNVSSYTSHKNFVNKDFQLYHSILNRF